MRAIQRCAIGLGLPLLICVYAACSGDAFEVSGSGSATSTSGAGGGATSTSSVGTGGDASSSVSSASGGGAATSTTSSATSSTTSAQSTGVGGAGGEATSGSSATVGAGGAGGGSDASWCEANGQMSYFCADFDSGDLLFGWDDFVFEPGLTGTPSSLLFTSPPTGLKVAGGADSADSWGVLSKDYPAGVSHTLVELDLRHTGALFAGTDMGSISLVTLSYDAGTVAFEVSATGFALRYQTGVDITLPVQPIPPDTWVRVGLSVTYSQFVQGGQLSVLYDGMTVGQIGNIQTLVDPNAMGMTMYLGQLRQGVTPAFSAVFDNVTWAVD